MQRIVKIYFFFLQPSLTKRVPSRDGRYNDGPRGNDNNKQRQMMQPQKIIEVKIEKVELHHTENAWKPGGKVNETDNGDSQVTTFFILKIKLI